MPPEQVTVLVFKDNYAARSFQIPLSWISRLGLALSAAVMISTVSTFLAIKYYRLSRYANPARVQDLELELADLQKQHDKNLAITPVTTAPHPTPLASATVAAANVAATPIPVTAALPSAKPIALQLPIGATASGGLLGPINPATATGPGKASVAVAVTAPAPQAVAQNLPDPSLLPFIITRPTLRWQGNKLRVRFSIQYTQGDGGNQQGRILIIARSADGQPQFTYPGNGRGEFFSVSRFRAVDGDIGPVRSKRDLQTVSVQILDTDGKVLIEQKIGTESAAIERAQPRMPKPETVDSLQPEETPSGDSLVSPDQPQDPAAAPEAQPTP